MEQKSVRRWQQMARKNKPRWKDLTFYERFAKRLKQKGACEEICEYYREKGKRKEENL